jgi:predicted transcriptional regulator
MIDKPKAPAGWLDAIERGIEDTAAGRTVSGDEVQQGLRDAIARLEARQSQTNVTAARRAG